MSKESVISNPETLKTDEKDGGKRVRTVAETEMNL
jgi:hypothetical protein